MAKKETVTIQLDDGKFITLDYDDIAFCEYRLSWGPGTPPGILFTTKDGVIYMVTYALQFKDIFIEMAKHEVLVLA